MVDGHENDRQGGNNDDNDNDNDDNDNDGEKGHPLLSNPLMSPSPLRR